MQGSDDDSESGFSGAAFAPLANPTYRSIWIANVASSLGTMIQGVAAAWVMLSISGGSTELVAMVQTATALPMLLFAMWGGVVADSFDRRIVMLTAQLVLIGLATTLTVIAGLDGLTPALLLAFTFAIGCCNSFNKPSWQASVGDIVPRNELPAAIALNSMAWNASRSIGPALGGVIVATAGPVAAFGLNAASYVGLVLALRRWSPKASVTRLPREPALDAMRAGFRYVAMSPDIQGVMLRAFIFTVGASAFLALLPIVAAFRLEGQASTYGLLLGAFGVGSVLGATNSARIQGRYSAETIVRVSFLAFALATAVIGASPWWPLTTVALIVGGVVWVPVLSLFNTSVQLSCARWVVGRTLSIYQSVNFGGMAIGSAGWGLAAANLDVGTAMVLAAMVLICGAAVGLWLPVPARSTANLSLLDREEPKMPDWIVPRSGPVLVAITYRVQHEDEAVFTELMAHRKRIRRRNGARHWRLMRDLQTPDEWTETSEFATWLDYVRHKLRLTEADRDIVTRLRALHVGEGRPRSTFYIERPTSDPRSS